MSLNDIVKCRKCENRAIVAGLCAGCASKELTRLRKLESALLGGFSREDAVAQLRLVAGSILLDQSWQRQFGAIADALEDSHG